jgi:hypothetical protein
VSADEVEVDALRVFHRHVVVSLAASASNGDVGPWEPAPVRRDGKIADARSLHQPQPPMII